MSVSSFSIPFTVVRLVSSGFHGFLSEDFRLKTLCLSSFKTCSLKLLFQETSGVGIYCSIIKVLGFSLVVVLSDNFYSLAQLSFLVNNFFNFFPRSFYKSFFVFRRGFLLYHTKIWFVKNFFLVFSHFSVKHTSSSLLFFRRLL